MYEVVSVATPLRSSVTTMGGGGGPAASSSFGESTRHHSGQALEIGTPRAGAAGGSSDPWAADAATAGAGQSGGSFPGAEGSVGGRGPNTRRNSAVAASFRSAGDLLLDGSVDSAASAALAATTAAATSSAAGGGSSNAEQPHAAAAGGSSMRSGTGGGATRVLTAVGSARLWGEGGGGILVVRRRTSGGAGSVTAAAGGGAPPKRGDSKPRAREVGDTTLARAVVISLLASPRNAILLFSQADSQSTRCADSSPEEQGLRIRYITRPPSASLTQEWEIDPDQVEVSASPMGVGAFGEVFKSTWRGAPVVVKRLKREFADDATALTELRAELAIWCRLHHVRAAARRILPPRVAAVVVAIGSLLPCVVDLLLARHSLLLPSSLVSPPVSRSPTSVTS